MYMIIDVIYFYIIFYFYRDFLNIFFKDGGWGVVREKGKMVTNFLI